jgi:hypothetical protein
MRKQIDYADLACCEEQGIKSQRGRRVWLRWEFMAPFMAPLFEAPRLGKGPVWRRDLPGGGGSSGGTSSSHSRRGQPFF